MHLMDECPSLGWEVFALETQQMQSDFKVCLPAIQYARGSASACEGVGGGGGGKGLKMEK